MTQNLLGQGFGVQVSRLHCGAAGFKNTREESVKVTVSEADGTEVKNFNIEGGQEAHVQDLYGVYTVGVEYSQQEEVPLGLLVGAGIIGLLVGVRNVKCVDTFEAAIC